jgi:hypothetical protein
MIYPKVEKLNGGLDLRLAAKYQSVSGQCLDMTTCPFQPRLGQ